MRLPIAEIEGMTGPDHDVLSNVYFDKEHGELIASDGFGMVVIPVDSDDEDVSGCVPTGVIQAARDKCGANVGLHNPTRARVETSEGGLWQRRPEGYPGDVREIASRVLANEEDCTVISLDAERLVRLVRALLDRSHHGGCKITLKIHGRREPVLVKPYYDYGDSRLGIIMPLEEK